MYIDLYFLNNWILNSWILSCVGREYGIRRRRAYLSGAAGALGACLWELGGFPDMLGPVAALPLSAIMLFLYLGQRPRRQWLQAFFKLYMYSFFVAGLIPVAGRYIPLWIGSVAAAYGGLRAVIHWNNRSKQREMELQIEIKGKACKLRGLIDSGNLLKDPIYHRPVIVIKKGVVTEESELQWPVPYQTIQGESVMFGFWPEKIKLETYEFKYHEVMVAATDEWKAKEYEAIIPEILIK